MKLRDRTKRVLINVKQEDRKPDRSDAESSTSITNGTDTAKLPIKQEDTKDHKLLLAQKGESATKGYYYQCDICNKRMADLESVLEHRISIHSISPRALKKDINMEPDINDPNFHCKSCEKYYSSRKLFRRHLKESHYLVLKPLPKQKAPRTDVVPNPDDPNLYCKACDHTYKRKGRYRSHCRYAHGMKLTVSTSGNAIDTYCQACDRRLSSIQSYRQHLVAVHKMNGRMIQQNQSDTLPNVNDPNFYCCSCDKTLANKRSFERHLMLVHSVFQSAPRMKSRLEPNIDDPRNCCRACQRTYTSKSTYRLHLRTVHQMALQASKISTDLPDPYNSDHYCSVCRKAYASSVRFRNHCKKSHFMVLDPYSIVNPAATININNPNHYCSQCKHSFFSKDGFKRHLRTVHHL